MASECAWDDGCAGCRWSGLRAMRGGDCGCEARGDGDADVRGRDGGMLEVGEGAATFVSADSLGSGERGGCRSAAAGVEDADEDGWVSGCCGWRECECGSAGGWRCGGVPALAACAPQACYEVYAAWKDGDPKLSAEKAERISRGDAVVLRAGGGGSEVCVRFEWVLRRCAAVAAGSAGWGRRRRGWMRR